MSDYEARQESQLRILLAGVVSLVGIYLLLQAFSKSWRFALILFISMLATLSGGLLAIFLSNDTFTVISLFGLLAVLGIGVRNSIMLINSYQRLEVEEGSVFNKGLVVHGSQDQFVPILISTLTIGLVLLVFIITGNISGQEIVFQLAIVILCGLVTSTLLNLFALPALYLRFGSHKEPDLGLND